MKRIVIIKCEGASEDNNDILYESIEELKEAFPQRQRYSTLHKAVTRAHDFAGFIKARHFTDRYPVFCPVTRKQVQIIDENGEVEGEDELRQTIKDILAKDTPIVESSDDQVSGLGFSSTQRNSVIAKVEGSFTRTVKINF